MSNITRRIAGAIVRMVDKAHRVYEKINLYHLKGQFKSIGKDPIIESPCSIMNPQCITIGDYFEGRRGLKLRAYTSWEDRRFTPVIRIGNHVHLAADVTINCLVRIEIGDHTGLGVNTKVMDHAHGLPNYEDLDIPVMKRELTSKGGVTIGKNVMIGTGVVILAGVEIGDNAIIGSNSVVTRSIPANSIAVGTPARVVRTIQLPATPKAVLV